MNRAIARRPLFETREDIRFFLAGLARAVRRGQIEVHAWCILTTHFHMLVRSPKGELSNAMHRIQNEYVRHFNRSRRRDGPLLRSRFRSKRVDSLNYRQLLVRYIDANPVQAGLCADPCHYAWCSARQYVARAGPRWLSREWVESWVAEQSESGHYDPREYPRCLGTRARARVASLVASRLETPSTHDDLDSLLGMAPPAVLERLRRQANLADGTASEQPHVAAASVTDAISGLGAQHGSWRICAGPRTIDGWSILHAGLLRDLAGSNFVAIARRLGVSSVHARRLCERHQSLLGENEHYARVASSTVHEILEDAFGVNR